jgi:hypothetical protein
MIKAIIMHKYLVVILSICTILSCSDSTDEGLDKAFTLSFEETKLVGALEISIDSIEDTRCNICAFNGSLLLHVTVSENGLAKEFYLEKSIFNLSDAFLTDDYKVLLVDCEPRVFGEEEPIIYPDLPFNEYVFTLMVIPR